MVCLLVASRSVHALVAVPVSVLALAGCAGLWSRRTARLRLRHLVSRVYGRRRSERKLLARLAALSHAPEARSGSDRQARVAALVGFLARQAGFSGRTASLLASASTLHRIGDLSAAAGGREPNDKTAALRAASLAGRLLAGDGWLHVSAAAMARCHRERWDGQGVPLGLSGSQLPFVGRLLHVALFLEAAIVEPVRDHAALQTVLDWLAAESGCSLDPVLVKLTLGNPDGLARLLARAPFAAAAALPARLVSRCPVTRRALTPA